MKENRMFIKGYQDAVNGIKRQSNNDNYCEGYLLGLNFKLFLEQEFDDDSEINKIDRGLSNKKS